MYHQLILAKQLKDAISMIILIWIPQIFSHFQL